MDLAWSGEGDFFLMKFQLPSNSFWFKSFAKHYDSSSLLTPQGTQTPKTCARSESCGACSGWRSGYIGECERPEQRIGISLKSDLRTT